MTVTRPPQFLKQREVSRRKGRLTVEQLRVSLKQGDIREIARSSVHVNQPRQFRSALEGAFRIRLAGSPHNPVLRKSGMGYSRDVPLGHVAGNAIIGRTPAFPWNGTRSLGMAAQTFRAIGGW